MFGCDKLIFTFAGHVLVTQFVKFIRAITSFHGAECCLLKCLRIPDNIEVGG